MGSLHWKEVGVLPFHVLRSSLTDNAGSGIGALTNLLKTHPVEELFPHVDFPETHNSPILKAAYIFSFLT